MVACGAGACGLVEGTAEPADCPTVDDPDCAGAALDSIADAVEPVADAFDQLGALLEDTDNDGVSNLDEVLAGSDPLNPLDGSTDPEEVRFFDSCPNAPPTVTPEFACSGPDDDGWTNAIPDNLAPCPAPPPGDCNQVVLGRLADTVHYIGCPGYTVLNRTDWTITLNDEFIACTASCDLGDCDPPAIIVSTRDAIPDFSLDIRMTTVTSRELCQFYNSGCTVVFADENAPGYVDCACLIR